MPEGILWILDCSAECNRVMHAYLTKPLGQVSRWWARAHGKGRLPNVGRARAAAEGDGGELLQSRALGRQISCERGKSKEREGKGSRRLLAHA
jgi:hypothetical protein